MIFPLCAASLLNIRISSQTSSVKLYSISLHDRSVPALARQLQWLWSQFFTQAASPACNRQEESSSFMGERRLCFTGLEISATPALEASKRRTRAIKKLVKV